MKENTPSQEALFPEIPLPQTVIHYCEQFGIQHIVISAGSRNAPLTNGFVENNYFKTYSVVDERAAAFFGLGMAQQLQQTVALVCTSGSALLNYYPAVAEAYYSNIPLVVISADRMPHRIDIGDGQTIQQAGVFGPHLVGASALKPDVSHAIKTMLESPLQDLVPADADTDTIEKIQAAHQSHNEQEIQRVLQLATTQKGPVHLNVPMEEPLYGMSTQSLQFSPITKAAQPEPMNHHLELEKNWKKATKKMILVGVLPPDSQWKSLLGQLMQDPSVVLLSEKTSNLHHPKAIRSIDCLLAPMEIDSSDFRETLQPELLLTLGGMIVSKKIKAFLRRYPANRHYHLDPIKAYDTFYHLHEHIKANPIVILKKLLALPKAPSSNYQETVVARYDQYLVQGQHYLQGIPFSDLKVFQTLFERLPSHLHLQIANSSPIRYSQLFNLPPSISVYCNRGTSGIDGSTATAIGAAQIRKEPTLLITGDLSFFYDSNGLWNNYIPPHFRIILINNNGGGIFRILPGEKDTDKYDTYFETIHQRSARHLARSFGFSYRKVATSLGLKWQLRSFFSASSKPRILEIQTPRKTNDTILLNYFKAMVK